MSQTVHQCYGDGVVSLATHSMHTLAFNFEHVPSVRIVASNANCFASHVMYGLCGCFILQSYAEDCAGDAPALVENMTNICISGFKKTLQLF